MSKKIKWIKITKQKIFIAVIGIVLLIGGYLVLINGTFAKKGIIVDSKDRIEIQSVIREFIRIEASKNVKPREEVIKEARELLKRPGMDLFSRNYIEGIIKGEIKVPVITECHSNLNFGEIEGFEKTWINIKVTEDRTCKYDDGSDTEGIYPHSFILVKKENKWRVERFEDGSEVKGEPLTEDVKKLLPAPSPEEVIKNQKIEDWRIKDNSATISSSYTYNRNNAAWYGWYYALNPNSSFRYWPNADCTNFISQAVWYGNWPMVWGYYRSTNVWWYYFGWPHTQSWTWINPHYWFWFTYNRPRGYLTSNGCSLQKGDIVQRDREPNGYMDHSMIVTDVRPGCNIRISYHTPNTRDQSLWEFISQYPNANFYGWRLYDSGN